MCWNRLIEAEEPARDSAAPPRAKRPVQQDPPAQPDEPLQPASADIPELVTSC